MNRRINENWREWLEIETQMKSWVRARWYSPEIAQDVLQGGLEKFLVLNKELHPVPQRIRFAQLCVKYAAREQGFWTEPKKEQEQGETVKVSSLVESLDQVTDSQPTALEMLLELEDHSRFIQLVKRLDAPLQRIFTAIIGGSSFGDAAKAEGMTSSEFSRKLAAIRREEGVAPRQEKAGEKANDQQLKLFL